MVSKKMGWLFGFALVAVMPILAHPVPGRAQETSRTFPETGKTVSGRFLEYWNAHGELAQQGFPISDVMQEVSDTDGKSYSVEYFERAVFEAHPENAAPYDMLLSQLGTLRYRQKYGGGATPAPGSTAPPTATVPPPATVTPTVLPPTNTPKPTKEVTPAPTMCPVLGDPGLSCRTSPYMVTAIWSVAGGAGRIEGTLTFEEDGGPSQTTQAGRSGSVPFWPRPACFGLTDPVMATVTLELHDECGQSVGSSCTVVLHREPCP